MINYLNDTRFLKELCAQRVRTVKLKVTVLTFNEEPIQDIVGKVISGNLTIDGKSNIRRTCNFSIALSEEDAKITDLNNIISLNKKIKLELGLNNTINPNYDDIVWFPLGIFVHHSPQISYSASGCTLNLTCKDKMCLLNGECGGTLPASVTFHEYDQMVYNEATNSYSTVAVKQRIYDIIQTLVCFFGGESLNNIFIEDIPLELKQIVRYNGSNKLYFNSSNSVYTTTIPTDPKGWKTFITGDEVGYKFADFTFPSSLVSNVGDSICTVLDKIKNTLGNHEYFYDVNGRFIFREKRNYLNTSFDPSVLGANLREDQNQDSVAHMNNISITNSSNCTMSILENTKTMFDFDNSNLIVSYSNTPSFTNIKNDFHLWGRNKSGEHSIHYHLAIKKKPSERNSYCVVLEKDKKGEYTGNFHLYQAGEELGGNEKIDKYIPADWRAELYLQGMVDQVENKRPSPIKQELLDWFGLTYDFTYKHTEDGDQYKGMYGKFKEAVVGVPNNLTYFLDYIEPNEYGQQISVESIGEKTMTVTQDNVVRLYQKPVPDVIMISQDDPDKEAIEAKCNLKGYSYATIPLSVEKQLSIGAMGIDAQTAMRNLLYEHNNYNESVNITCIPVYFLEPNTRISILNNNANMNGDYIINTLTIPLNGSQPMTISATRALERI